jgi:hypothetical protein
MKMATTEIEVKTPPLTTCKLPEQLEELGFTDKNISSIGGRGKRNSQETLQTIADALLKHANSIDDLMKATGLKPTNISSMLHGAGQHVGAGIEALVENQESITKIMDAGFDAKSISSMHHARGSMWVPALRRWWRIKRASQRSWTPASMPKASPACLTVRGSMWVPALSLLKAELTSYKHCAELALSEHKLPQDLTKQP